LTPELIKKLTDYVAQGNYYSTAFYAVDIDDSTFYKWMEQGRQDYEKGVEGLYLDLISEVKRAEAEAEVERVARIRQAGIGGQVSRRVTRLKKDGTEETEETFQLPQWLADITFLERRHPDRWGRRDRTRIDINETREITITHVEYNLAEPGQSLAIEGESRPSLKEGLKEGK
jgi:transposase-like protein